MNGATKRVSKRSKDEQVCLDFIEQIRNENIAVERQISRKSSGELSAPPLTFTELLREYSKARESRRQNTGKPQESTLRAERGIIKTRIIPVLGEVRLANLDTLPFEIQRFQRELRTVKSEKTGKLLSESRKRKAALILKQCLEWGARQGYVQDSLIHEIELPSQEPSNPKNMVLERGDPAKLVAYLDSKGCEHTVPKQLRAGVCRLRWLLALQTGRRSSEVLGMSWDDVELTGKNPYFKVTQQLARRPWQHGCGKSTVFADGRRGFPCEVEFPIEARYCHMRMGGGLYLTAGTKGGKQLQPQIPIDSYLLDAFIEHKRVQQKEIAKAIENETADPEFAHMRNLVFLQANTLRPFGHRHDAKIWQEIVGNAKLSKRKYTPHQLRHTAATLLLEQPNTEIKQVSQILGHKSILTTQKYVNHDIQALQPSIESFAASLRK